jgi:hypothetical protein
VPVFNLVVLLLLCRGSSKHFFQGSRDFLIPTPKLPKLVRSRAAGSSIALREESNLQEGSVIRKHRKLGPDVWSYRWWESGPNGNRVHRPIVLGTAEQLRDLSSTRQMTTGLMREINATDIRMAGISITVDSWLIISSSESLLLERTNLVLHQEYLSGLPWQMDHSPLGRLHPPEHQSCLPCSALLGPSSRLCRN